MLLSENVKKCARDVLLKTFNNFYMHVRLCVFYNCFYLYASVTFLNNCSCFSTSFLTHNLQQLKLKTLKQK